MERDHVYQSNSYVHCFISDVDCFIPFCTPSTAPFGTPPNGTTAAPLRWCPHLNGAAATIVPQPWRRRVATATFGVVLFSRACSCQARGRAVCRRLTFTPCAPLSAAPTVMADEKPVQVVFDEKPVQVDLCKINALVTLRSRKAVYRPIKGCVCERLCLW